MSRITLCAAPALALVLLGGSGKGADAIIAIAGGVTVNGQTKPLLFTWNAPVPFTGSGWQSGEMVAIVLHGPFNSPGITPADFALGALTADGQGNLSGAVTIPYDGGATGPSARILRPGAYQVQGVGAASGTAAGGSINLCPATYVADAGFDWGHERGGRDGVLPGGLRQVSPERSDPEWPEVWDERPVEAYGTVSGTGTSPSSQPALISPIDNPLTHYAHDSVALLDLDPQYQWLAGTANYYAEQESAAQSGKLGIEWETLNGGSTGSYGQGSIGLPLWAQPSVGDRVYVVGRWTLDAGHPELGDRTEIHPPRLLATMRQRPALASNGASALEVDLYVSGHGGGANHMPPGLTKLLDQYGYGGGRIRDVLTAADQTMYYQPGPAPPLLQFAVVALVQQISGQSVSSPIAPVAGPTAFPWGAPGGDERAINDMDYDFDVPLPPATPGATSVAMETVTQAQHTTAVNEVVTYTNVVNGLPTSAHVHLPYAGADNSIYARTLKFFWNTSAPPAAHWRVHLNAIRVVDTGGKWQLWADVSGQWSYLSGLAPALMNASDGQTINIPGSSFDIYVQPKDSLRIYVQGYRAQCVDGYFGRLFDMNVYAAGLRFLTDCGPANNDDLGGALFEAQPSAGVFSVAAKDSAGQSHFQVDFTVDAVQ